jgi:hypothetical protein
MLENMIDTRELTEDVAKKFFARDAILQFVMFDELYGPVSLHHRDGTQMSLFHFAVRFFPEFDLMRGRPKWVDEYIDQFPNSEIVKRDRLKKNSE